MTNQKLDQPHMRSYIGHFDLDIKSATCKSHSRDADVFFWVHHFRQSGRSHVLHFLNSLPTETTKVSRHEKKTDTGYQASTLGRFTGTDMVVGTEGHIYKVNHL